MATRIAFGKSFRLLVVLAGLVVASGCLGVGRALAAPPVNTVPPIVSGSFQVGQTLTALSGDWSRADPLRPFSYQWQDCTSYPNAVLADSPVGYWRLDEASGASAADASGNHNDGVYGGSGELELSSPGGLSGDGDASVVLNGDGGGGNYVDVPDAVVLRPGSFTLEARIKAGAAISSGVVIAKPNVAGSQLSYGLQLVGGRPQVVVTTSSGTFTASSTVAVNDNSWHQLDGSYDAASGTLSIRVDGGYDVSTAASGTVQYDPALNLELGRFDASAGQPLTGYLDEAAVYASALSGARVQAHASAATSVGGAAPCVDIAGATTFAYTLKASDLGKRVQVRVTAANDDGISQPAGSASWVVTGSSPRNVGVPTIAGSARAGQALSATTGSWATGSGLTYRYLWQRCGVYPNAVLADRPLGWWRLGDANGQVAFDSGPNSLSGTYSGGHSRDPGRSVCDANGSAWLAGGGEVDTPTSGFPTTSGSYELWFYLSALPSTGAGLYAQAHVGTDHSLRIRLNAAGQLCAGIAWEGDMCSPASVSMGHWHYVVLTRSGSSWLLYLDAQQVASQSSSSSMNPRASRIGVFFNGSSWPGIVGDVDEFAIYPTALSPARIQAHYASGGPPVPIGSPSTSPDYTLADGDVDSMMRVQVTATGGDNLSTNAWSALSQTVVGPNSPLNSVLPTITGTLQLDQTLTAGLGSWTGTPTPTYSEQWLSCANYGAAVKADSPLGYWRLGETTGGTATDSSGSGNNGSYAGGVGLGTSGAIPCDSNTAAGLNGSDGRIDGPTAGLSATTGTWELWFNATTLPASDRSYGLYSQAAAITDHSLRIRLDDAGSICAGIGWVGDHCYAANVQPRRWHYVALTRAGSAWSLYLDGGPDPVASWSDASAMSVNASSFGRFTDGISWYGFDGSLDELAIYPGALAGSAIETHYAAAAKLLGTGPSYQLQARDVGSRVRLAVTATNTAGGTTVLSALTARVSGNGAAINTSAPTLSGRGVVGEALTTTHGGWSGSPTIRTEPPTWQRCGYRSAVLSGSPLGYWRLGEPSGASAADLGSGANGASYGGSGYTLAQTGAICDSDLAVSFAGGSSYLELANTVQFNSGPFTIEAWLKTTSASGTRMLWESGFDGGFPHVAIYQRANGRIEASAGDTTGAITLSPTTAYNDGAWHQVALTRAGGSYTLYIDGAAGGSSANGPSGDLDSAGVLPRIGNGTYNAAYGWVGSIDEVAIFTSALAAATIASHYSAATTATAIIDGNGYPVTGDSYTPTAADAGSTVTSLVTAHNSLGSATATSAPLTILAAPPAPDSPNQDGAVASLTPTLKVFAIANISPASVQYSWELAGNAAFTSVLASGSSGQTLSWQVPTSAGLKDGGGYFWRAQATYNGVTTGWTQPQRFNVRVNRLGTSSAWPVWSSGPLAVNEATGNLILSLPGPSFPTPSGSMAISFTYNSLDTVDHGLGAGWSLVSGDASAQPPVRLVDHSLLEGADQYDAAEVVWADGGSSYYGHIAGSNSYVAQPGDGAELKRNGDGSWTLTDGDGSIYSFGISAATNGVATLISAELFDAAPDKGRLDYAYDGNGKLVQLTDHANPGRSLVLSWACTGALLCISGPDGVSWRYAGDGGGGTSGRISRLTRSWTGGSRDLLQIGYGVNGLASSYENADDLSAASGSPDSNLSPNYSAAHQVSFRYDAHNRLTSLTEGPVAGQSSTWSFDYASGGTTAATQWAHGSLPAGPRSAAGNTTITAPNQQGQPSPKTTTVYYDDFGHPLETLDQLGRITQSGWNSHDQLVWQEDATPQHNPTDNTWDPVTDVLLTTLGPDPDGRGPLGRSPSDYRYDEMQIGTGTGGPAGRGSPGVPLQGLRANYYTNTQLLGRPAASQTDSNVEFDWQSAGPSALAGTIDSFSVRWSGYLNVPSEGDYSFSTYADEGTRLTIDGSLVINDWTAHTAHSAYGQLQHLTAGLHKLTLEYYELTGPAKVHLRWSCSDCAERIDQQPIPASALQPGWENRTSTVSPSGRVTFSHYASPASGLPDYTLARDDTGANLITSFSYDQYGRITEKVTPKGNLNRTIDGQGNLQGQLDSTYATDYSYYPAGASPAIPGFCGGGSAPDQAQALQQIIPHGPAATSFVYDAAGHLLAKADGAGISCAHYSPEGRLASRADGDGHTTSYAYDPSGQLVTTTLPDASTNKTAYDEAGAVASTTDGNDHTTTFVHDLEGHLIDSANPLGKHSSYSYDAAGNRRTAKNPDGKITSFEYDELNRLIATVSPANARTGVGYDPYGHPVSRTDANGNMTTYAYDSDGKLVTTSYPDPGHSTVSNAYDALGRLKSTTDQADHTTSYGYDRNSQQTSITAPDGGTTNLAYDPVGNLTSRSDPNQHVTQYTYDSANRLIQTQLPTGEKTQLAYDNASNRISSTDPAGKTTSYGYDALNRLISTRTPLGEVFRIGYDQAGNITSRTDPNDQTTRYTYDAANQLLTSTDPLGNVTTLAYDDAGQLRSRQDANQHTTRYGHDDDGRIHTVTGRDGSLTSLGYDANGNLTSRQDDNGHTSHYGYDQLNRLVSRSDPLERTWTYSYDGVGNRTKTVDGNGNATPDPTDGTTSYSYDPVNRLKTISYSDSTPSVSFGYDLAGNRTSMQDGAGSQSYGYDDSNRLISISRGSQAFGYAYDSAGRLQSRSYPDGTQTSYGYNDDGRLASVTSGGFTTSYSYDPAGNLENTALPNDWSEHRSYDNAGRLTDIRSVNGAQTLAAATYTLDGLGNPTRIVRDGQTETYDYDEADRITKVCYGGELATCPSSSLISYGYDKVGNRTRQNIYGTTTTYAYDAADQLRSTTTGGQTTSYSYDDNGNQTSFGSRAFSYDLAGRVTSITDAGTTLASFSYDGQGIRLSKTAGSQTTNYLWDENNPLPQLALEKNGTSVVRAYTYGLDLVSMSAGDSGHYYHHDKLGTTAAITSSSGAIEWAYSYDAYGGNRAQTKVDPSGPDNAIQFTGQLQDPETGLYYFRARLYDPTTGRFLSSDPLPEAATDPALTDYTYANDQPLVLTDPSGLRFLDDDARKALACATCGPGGSALPASPSPGPGRSPTPPPSVNPMQTCPNGSTVPAGSACPSAQPSPQTSPQPSPQASAQPSPASTHPEPAAPAPRTAAGLAFNPLKVEPKPLVRARKRIAREVIKAATTQLDVPYVWGGETPRSATSQGGFDCSGLIQWAFGQVEISLPRTTYAQIDKGTSVNRHSLASGDLIFFDTDANKGGPDHVGIFIAGNSFIHASSGRGKVVISTITSTNYYGEHYYGARRVIP